MDVCLGIIGVGYWGLHLLRNFNEVAGCKVRMVCDSNPERLEKVKRTYPSVICVRDYEQVVRQQGISAIVIATPASCHYKMARNALLAGKHVLVEKPMTLRADEAIELTAIAKLKEKVLMADHTFLYTGSIKKIKEIMVRGELGEIYYIDSVRINLGMLRSDVNVVWDLLAHDLSIINYLTGLEPTYASAIGRSVGNSSLEYMAHITLKYPNNILAHAHVNWLSPTKERKMIIGGSRKMVIYNDIEPVEKVKIYDRGLELSEPSSPKYRSGDVLAPKLEQREALFNMATHFVECILGNNTPLTDGQSGLSVAAALDASVESLAKNGEWVKVNHQASEQTSRP